MTPICPMFHIIPEALLKKQMFLWYFTICILASGIIDINSGSHYSESILFQKSAWSLRLKPAWARLCYSGSGATVSAGVCPLVLPSALHQSRSHKATFHFNCNLEEVIYISQFGWKRDSTFLSISHFQSWSITPQINTAGKNPQSWKLLDQVEREKMKRRCFLEQPVCSSFHLSCWKNKSQLLWRRGD